jgi:prohibitin 1
MASIIVDNLSLTNINFSADFNNAVESAQVALQNAKRAEYDVKRVKNEADAAIAKAEGEAKAQQLQQQTLSPEVLQKLFLDKWDGHLPTYYGQGALPFLNIQK